MAQHLPHARAFHLAADGIEHGDVGANSMTAKGRPVGNVDFSRNGLGCNAEIADPEKALRENQAAYFIGDHSLPIFFWQNTRQTISGFQQKHFILVWEVLPGVEIE